MGMLNNLATPEQQKAIEEWKMYMMAKQLQAQQLAKQKMLQGQQYIDQNVMPMVSNGLMRGAELMGEGGQAVDRLGAGIYNKGKGLWDSAGQGVTNLIDMFSNPAARPSDVGIGSGGSAQRLAEEIERRKREIEKIK